METIERLLVRSAFQQIGFPTGRKFRRQESNIVAQNSQFVVLGHEPGRHIASLLHGSPSVRALAQ
jgi:hypothetical protein